MRKVRKRMTTRRTGLLAILFSLATTAFGLVAAGVSLSSNQASQITAIAEKEMNDAGIPGLSLAVRQVS